MKQKFRSFLENTLNQDFEVLEKTTNFKELNNWDSLLYITLVIAIETEFDVKLNKDDIKNILSVENIKDILKNKGKNFE